MPLYEYECDDCGHRFELIQKFSDELATTCPKCSGSLRKLLSSPAIQFKGSGWYITDYARKGEGQGSPAPSDNSDKSETAAAKGADSSKTKSADTKSDKKPSSSTSSNGD